MDQQEVSSKKDVLGRIWDDAQQLSALRDRAQQCGDRLSKVLFQASLQTLEDQQLATAYRQRVTQALLESADTPPTITMDTPTLASQVSAPMHEHHLTPPKPVMLFEDPLKYKTVNPTSVTAMTEQDMEHVQNEMDQSRDVAILMEEARSELFRPLLGLAACIGLIVAIGLGAYYKGWISQPQQAIAQQTVDQSVDVPPTQVVPATFGPIKADTSAGTAE